jgi:hypothetical protein
MSNATQDSLDSLRKARDVQYNISQSTLSSWSLDDQEKYANNLHRLSRNIINLEAAKTGKLSSSFKQSESTLKNAAERLAQFAENDSNYLLMIRSINSGLSIVDEIVALAK